ncbi:MAG: TRAP transporter large permease [Clostridiales bacterium]
MDYDPTIATTILIGLFVVLLIFRIPITFSLVISSIVTAIYMDLTLISIVQNMVRGVNSFSLLAIPFFIIMGELMGAGGISNRIVKFANIIVGRIRGGLAMVNVLASMFFGGISGSVVADISSLGPIVVPMMKKKGYDKDFSVAVTVSSACQGVIIPPSHNMILFSLAAGGVSVGKLFLGGYIPGILLGLCLAIICFIISIKKGYPKEKSVSIKEAIKITLDAILGLITALIVVGGVVFGIFTATEAAAFACLYAFVITFFVYREIKISYMNKILFSSLKTLAVVMSLIMAASAFGSLLAMLQIPSKVTGTLLTITENTILLLLLINLMLILLGCIMDMAPLIIICTPILYPVVVDKLGMDPVQFGVMMVLNLAIGLCTPPVGSALFVGCSVGKTTIEGTTKALIPFYVAMVIALFFVTFVPQFTTFLPNLLMP